jgi:hypothetical protein
MLHCDQPARRDLRKEMGSFSLSGRAVYSCDRFPCTLFQAFAIISQVVQRVWLRKLSSRHLEH